MEEPKEGERYAYFNGEDKIYEIIAVARDCENPDKRLVIYKSLYAGEFPIGTTWFRDLVEFIGDKVFEDGTEVKRFKLIEDKDGKS